MVVVLHHGLRVHRPHFVPGTNTYFFRANTTIPPRTALGVNNATRLMFISRTTPRQNRGTLPPLPTPHPRPNSPEPASSPSCTQHNPIFTYSKTNTTSTLSHTQTNHVQPRRQRKMRTPPHKTLAHRTPQRLRSILSTKYSVGGWVGGSVCSQTLVRSVRWPGRHRALPTSSPAPPPLSQSQRSPVQVTARLNN